MIGRDLRRVKDVMQENFQSNRLFKRMQYGLENFARLSPGSWCEAGKILVESERKSAILSRMSLESLRPRVRARVATHVFLRLTAMDVCCGPPASR
jgi:hypothetical protein